MKRILCAALVAAALCIPTPAATQPLELKLARVLSWQKKYDESIERYRSYLSSHPGDLTARLELGDVCFWTKRYECAREEYGRAGKNPKFAAASEKRMAALAEAEGDLKMSEEYLRRLLAADPANTDARLKLAKTLSYERRYAEAISEFDAAIAADPGNAAALSERADVLSWEERYAESVEGYDASLAIRFDPEVARQKARVLGWWKKYGRAIEAYDDAYAKSKIEGIALERDGKEAFWNRWVLTSIERYRALLETEPKNVEAHFDLGQVEGFQRMWADAAGDFGQTHKEQPWHFRAEDSLEKVELMRSKRLFVPYANWLYARSDSRDTHIKRFGAGARLSQPVADHAELTAGYSFDDFFFTDASSIPRHQGRIGAVGWLSPWISADASFLPTGYPSDGRMSWLWEGSVSARPIDPLLFTAFTRRDDLTNQRIVFDKRLRTTDAGANLRADVHRRWVSSVDFKYSWLNDSNSRTGAGASQLVYLSYEPYRLTLDARFDFFTFRNWTTDYWSPQNYWSTSGTLHWRHYFNPHGMYFGALERYWGVQYRFQIDRGLFPFNGGAAEFHYDFNRRVGIHIEARGGRSSVYYDFGSDLRLTARF